MIRNGGRRQEKMHLSQKFTYLLSNFVRVIPILSVISQILHTYIGHCLLSNLVRVIPFPSLTTQILLTFLGHCLTTVRKSLQEIERRKKKQLNWDRRNQDKCTTMKINHGIPEWHWCPLKRNQIDQCKPSLKNHPSGVTVVEIQGHYPLISDWQQEYTDKLKISYLHAIVIAFLLISCCVIEVKKSLIVIKFLFLRNL